MTERNLIMNVLIYSEAKTREEVMNDNQFIIDKLTEVFPDKEIVTYYLPLNGTTVEKNATQFIRDFRFQVTKSENVETPEGKNVNLQYGNTFDYYFDECIIFTHVESPDYITALCEITGCGAATLVDTQNQKPAEFDASIHEISVDDFKASSIVYNVPDSTQEDYEALRQCFFGAHDHSGLYPHTIQFVNRMAYETLVRDYIIHIKDSFLEGALETLHTLPTYLLFDYSLLTNEEMEYFRGYNPTVQGFSIMDFIDSAPTKLSQRLIELTVAYDSKFGSIGCEIPRRCMHLAGYTENIEAILDHLSEKLDSIDKELVEYILINPSVDDYESIKSYVDNNTSLGITEARTTPKEYVQSLDLNEGDICVDYDASTPVLVQFSPGFRSSKFDEYILDRFTNMCMLMDSRKKGEDDE
jgi:hypothetical protein